MMARPVMTSSFSCVSRYLGAAAAAQTSFLYRCCRCNSTSVTRNSDDIIEALSQPFRSLLYVPASNKRALEKLSSLQGSNRPDGIILDLEDGVIPSSKDSARENLVHYFQQRDDVNKKDRFHIVRINSVNTPWFAEDISAVVQIGSDVIDGISLPKVEKWEDVELISRELHNKSGDADDGAIECDNSNSTASATISPIPIWPMIETPRAVLSSLSISSHPSIHGLLLGTNDLAKDLNLGQGGNNNTREGLITSLQMTILAARANGKFVIDGVYNNFRDGDGLYQECIQGKTWGMDGKTLIHPNQVQTANEVFAPSEKEVEYARRLIACWDDAKNSSKGQFSGVAVLDGIMVEELHVKSARMLLGRAETIAHMVKDGSIL
jgi:(3S)-malyl-CoA thioesterase